MKTSDNKAKIDIDVEIYKDLIKFLKMVLPSKCEVDASGKVVDFGRKLLNKIDKTK